MDKNYDIQMTKVESLSGNAMTSLKRIKKSAQRQTCLKIILNKCSLEPASSLLKVKDNTLMT